MNKLKPYLLAPLAPLFLWSIVEPEWITSMPEGLLYIGYCAVFSYVMTAIMCFFIDFIILKRKGSLLLFSVFSGAGGLVWWLLLAALEGNIWNKSDSIPLFVSFGVLGGLTFSVTQFCQNKRSTIPSSESRFSVRKF